MDFDIEKNIHFLTFVKIVLFPAWYNFLLTQNLETKKSMYNGYNLEMATQGPTLTPDRTCFFFLSTTQILDVSKSELFQAMK